VRIVVRIPTRWLVVINKNLMKWGEALLEEAEKGGWLGKLLARFKKPVRVIVLGSTGTGKTNLLESLTKTLPDAIDAMNRTEFAERHKIRIKGKPFVFVDLPGQKGHSHRRLSAIRDAMTRDKPGVLNVTAYGYHEYRIGAEEALDNGNVKVDYIEKHRLVEIDALTEWVGLLGHRNTARWLITVVTKADLWWGRKKEVMEHYECGSYRTALRAAESLNPSTLPYSSVLHKFYGVGSLAGSLDENGRLGMRTNLLKTLLAAGAETN
jgi:energy-coupling factor transporter ATP-binding protein EcfA2